MAVTEWADHIGRCSIVLMWTALIIRARPAWRERQQRGLWLAILTAAIATTLFQPQAVDWAVDVTGNAHAVTLSRNIVGVLAAGLMLLFVVESARPRRARLIIAAALSGTLIALVGMDLARGDYPGPTIPAPGLPAEPSAAYWLIVCASHLIADVVVVVLCVRYSVRTDDRDLAWSLRLFALGSILALGYWAGCLVHLYLRIPEAWPWLTALINVHGVCRACTLLVPTASSAARLVREARAVWVLWPLWRDLSAAVPTVALVPPQPTRLHQLLRPGVPLAFQAHRQTIEIYDAILHLQSHLAPLAHERAAERTRKLRIPAADAPAAALAGVLEQARRAKLAGEPAAEPRPLPGLDDADAALLLAVARHWPAVSRTAAGPEQAP